MLHFMAKNPEPQRVSSDDHFQFPISNSISVSAFYRCPFAAAQSAGAVGSISSVSSGIVTGIGTAGGAALGAAGSAFSWLRGKVSF